MFENDLRFIVIVMSFGGHLGESGIEFVELFWWVVVDRMSYSRAI